MQTTGAALITVASGCLEFVQAAGGPRGRSALKAWPNLAPSAVKVRCGFARRRISAAFAVAALLAGLPFAGPAAAQAPSPALGYSVEAGLASDYVFRGVDQTNRGVQGFGGAELEWKDLYAGSWASNVDFRRFGDRRTDAEIDAYAGWRPTVKGFDLDLGAIYYGYAGHPGGEDYWEGYAKAARGLGPLRFQVSAYASPNDARQARASYYLEARADYRVTPKWSVWGSVSRRYEADGLAAALDCAAVDCAAVKGGLGYTTWALALAYALTDRLGLDLRYTDTDAHGLGEPFGAEALVTLKASFP